MGKQIIHGIGKAVIRDFKNPKKIIAFGDLQDLSIESTSSQEDIAGGNKMFPIASFKTDQALTISNTNASFSVEMMEYLEGATRTVGVTKMTDILEVAIPDTLTIELPHTPVAESVSVQGFELGTATVTAGNFTLTGEELTFHADDVGKKIFIVYEYSSSADAVEYSVTQASIAKPFVFDYIFPIYDEDSQITHNGMVKIFKAQSTSGFSLNPQHKTAFAPKFEASAKDASRVDGKQWTFTVDGVTVV